MPGDGCSVETARGYTSRLAKTHYENFRVAAWLLPRRLHQAFYDIYAYCRWSDDLGDEAGDPRTALALLDWWEGEFDRGLEGRARHPVIIALAQAMAENDLPAQPFRDLLRAFRQDQSVTRYPDWESLLDYSRYSANPVGRLVLALAGYRDAERQRLSDCTCTGLQLANFWQDVSRDWRKGRIYLPLDRMAAHGLGEADVARGRFDERYAALMRELVERTRAIFEQGKPLVEMVSREWRVDIELFGAGGMAVLDAIERIGFNTLERRPVVRKATQMRLLAKALAGCWLGGESVRAGRVA